MRPFKNAHNKKSTALINTFIIDLLFHFWTRLILRNFLLIRLTSLSLPFLRLTSYHTIQWQIQLPSASSVSNLATVNRVLIYECPFQTVMTGQNTTTMASRNELRLSNFGYSSRN